MSRSRKLKKAGPRTADHGRRDRGTPAFSADARRAVPETTASHAEAEPATGPEPEPAIEPEPAAELQPQPTPLRAEPEPASRSHRRGRRIVALAVLAAAALIAGFGIPLFIAGVVVPLIAPANDEPASEAPRAAPTLAPSPSARVAAPSAGPNTQPQSEHAPRSMVGPGQTRPGILVQAQLDAEGGLEVVERVRFESPQRVLRLGLPSLRGATGDVATLKPRIEELQVSADGELVSVPEKSRVVTAASMLQLPRATQTLVLRYRVENASWRSLPGPPGRALVVMPPISTLPANAAPPVVIEVTGGTVHNLLCPALDRKHQLCGHADGATWYTAELPAGHTAVVAQVDLPAPGA